LNKIGNQRKGAELERSSASRTEEGGGSVHRGIVRDEGQGTRDQGTGIATREECEGRGSRMGIWDSGMPERERGGKRLTGKRLGGVCRADAFRFGTAGGGGGCDRLRESDGKFFPYQELRGSVLVWHATCIRRGQKNRKWEQETGNREQGTGNKTGVDEARFGDHCPLSTVH
jgi:hypothetical protein